MTTKVHQWIHGAASALIGGAANAVTVCIIDPVKVYKSPYPWSEVSLDRRKKYEKVARLFLATMKKSTPAAKPSNKV